jgi:hypothetical protein
VFYDRHVKHAARTKDRLALRPGRPRKHLGLTLFDPLCAACNLFFLRRLQGRLCCSRACGPLTGWPRTARSHRSHTEPSISEEGKYLFPPSSTGAPHRSERAVFSRKSPEPLGPSGALYQRGRKASGEKWLNFVLTIPLPRNRKRFLTCRKSATRDPQLFFPSERRHA